MVAELLPSFVIWAFLLALVALVGLVFISEIIWRRDRRSFLTFEERDFRTPPQRARDAGL